MSAETSSIIDEMREAIRELAGPRSFTDTRESWLSRAARRAGITFRQAKAFHYGETMNPRVADVEKVRAAVRSTAQAVEGRQAGANDELAELRARLDHLEKLVAEARLLHRRTGT
jgi:hypothetical protein